MATHPPPGKKGKHGTKRRRLSAEETEAILKQHGIDLDGIPLDHAGHAQRMFDIAEDEGADIAFLTRHDGGSWAVFDTTIGRWSREAPSQRIGSWVMEIGNLMLDWANTLRKKYGAEIKLPEDQRTLSADELINLGNLSDTLLAEGTGLRKSGGVSAIRNIAASFRKYHISEADFDRDFDRIIVANGILDLQTGTLSSHTPKFLATRHLPVFYDYTALEQESEFSKFIKLAVPDDELRDWLQVSAGYWLTGHNTEQALWLLHGPTGTGKSTMIGAITEVMGKMRRGGYSKPAPRGLFRKEHSHWGDTARLENARLVIDAEYAEATVVDGSLIKMLTGETDLDGNVKYGRYKEFDLQAKFVLMTNHLPSFGKDRGDAALFRRVFVVNMAQQLYARAYAAGDYRELPKKLRTKAEQEWILAWMVEGARRWYSEPLHKNVPAAVQRASRSWRQSMGGGDMIREALSEAGFLFQGDLWTPTADLLTVINDFMAVHKQPTVTAEKFSVWANGEGMTKKQRKISGRVLQGWWGAGR